MILFRYLAAHIIRGALTVLLVLVALSLFFTMVRELDDLGTGNYGGFQMLQYLLYKIPGFVVDFMPLAVLIGCLLSLGNLASGSEIIVMQASGLSLWQLLVGVGLSVFILALLALAVGNLLVPAAETSARNIRTSSIESRVSFTGREGVWIKDRSNILHIDQLLPDGHARNVKIFHLDQGEYLSATTFAQQALLQRDGWKLQSVQRSLLQDDQVTTEYLDTWIYPGQLAANTLQSMVANPQQMSIRGLAVYIGFLKDNGLSSRVESLSLWQKVYQPVAIIVMGLLAIPFVLGSQRQSNTGQRVMTGILLGLMYVVLNRLLIQVGEQAGLATYINALLPTLIFTGILAWLLHRKHKNT
jgi:lipopolysaccharide export system permease protein